jgi:hypothetical protein
MATKSKPAGDLVYLCRELKAPSLGRAVERLAERARAAAAGPYSWDSIAEWTLGVYEEVLAG